MLAFFSVFFVLVGDELVWASAVVYATLFDLFRGLFRRNEPMPVTQLQTELATLLDNVAARHGVHRGH
jgi:hypothetical protein